MPFYIKKKPKNATAPKETGKKRTKPNLVEKLDRVFALYIRLRDTMPSGYFKCISCGKIKHFSEGDCGHFYSRRHMSTRFDEDNAHHECRGCNRFSAEHLIGYQTNLIRKIGMGRFELLGTKAHQSKQWHDFELEALIKHYKAEVKRLSAERGIAVKV